MGQQKRAVYYERFIHRRAHVLAEYKKIDDEGRWKGVSRNYIPVWIRPQGERHMEEMEVEITDVRGAKVLGRIVQKEPRGRTKTGES